MDGHQVLCLLETIYDHGMKMSSDNDSSLICESYISLSRMDFSLFALNPLNFSAGIMIRWLEGISSWLARRERASGALDILPGR